MSYLRGLLKKFRSTNTEPCDTQGKSRKNKDLGDLGERIAERHLCSIGFSVVARNVRYGCGEIDLIATRGGELHFVEVKTTGRGSRIDPLEQVTAKKRQRMRRAAELYLKISRNKFSGQDLPPCYFSVIGIDCNGAEPAVECILDAFE